MGSVSERSIFRYHVLMLMASSCLHLWRTWSTAHMLPLGKVQRKNVSPSGNEDGYVDCWRNYFRKLQRRHAPSDQRLPPHPQFNVELSWAFKMTLKTGRVPGINFASWQARFEPNIEMGGRGYWVRSLLLLRSMTIESWYIGDFRTCEINSTHCLKDVFTSWLKRVQACWVTREMRTAQRYKS